MSDFFSARERHDARLAILRVESDRRAADSRAALRAKRATERAEKQAWLDSLVYGEAPLAPFFCGPCAGCGKDIQSHHAVTKVDGRLYHGGSDIGGRGAARTCIRWMGRCVCGKVEGPDDERPAVVLPAPCDDCYPAYHAAIWLAKWIVALCVPPEPVTIPRGFRR